MLRACAVAAFLALAAIPARAATCATVIDGAETGPAPYVRDWRWTNACYIAWPGGYVGQLNARDIYEKKCKGLPGFLKFEGDYGSNRNLCIFSAPASGPEDEPAKSVEPKGGTAALTKDQLLYAPLTSWRMAAPRQTQLDEAQAHLAEAKGEYRSGNLIAASFSFGMATSALSSRDGDRNVVRLGEYAACMSNLPTLLLSARNGTLKESNFLLFEADCGTIRGEFLQEGMVELRSATSEAERKRQYNESEQKRHEALAEQAPIVPAPAGTDGRCLVFHKPLETRIACAKGKPWLLTHIGAAGERSLGCPNPVRFRYVDETGEQVAQAPVTLQTCGDPPLKVRVEK